MNRILLLTISASLLLLSWCIKITFNDPNKTQIIENNQINNIEEDIYPQEKNDLEKEIIKALKNKDIARLSKFVSAEWVRFSPYWFVDTDIHITLQKDEIQEAFESNIQYVRWHEDGTWDPLLLTFQEYFSLFVYDLDFQTLAEKFYDLPTQRWNSINNIEEIYHGKPFIEYFIAWVNPEYEWIDRRSLTLVLTQENSERKLRAIIHNQRTI